MATSIPAGRLRPLVVFLTEEDSSMVFITGVEGLLTERSVVEDQKRKAQRSFTYSRLYWIVLDF